MRAEHEQDPEPAVAAELARRVRALREAVLAEWETRVRASFGQASRLAPPILIDTLPAFYDNIAATLDPGSGRAIAVQGSTLAAEHGGERARLTTYDHHALVGEYQLFRKVLFEVLYRHGLALGPREVMLINASIDGGIKEAVAAFAEVHGILRERFAAALTHDLRSPLGAAAAALECIMLLDDPGAMRALAARALDNVQRMDGMLRELLDTMVAHDGGRLALDLACVEIGAVVDEVRTAVPGRAARIRVEGSPVRGWWDRAALRRALENLVDNALKHGREGSPVTMAYKEEYGRLLLSVHNEGPPIAIEDREAIFQLYRRAETAKLTRRQGWGVGLAYVRAVAESHGGSIGLESDAGKGTCFLIDIPLDARPFGQAPSIA